LSRGKNNDSQKTLIVAAGSTTDRAESFVREWGSAFWIGFVLIGRTSLRGASAVWEYLREFFPGLPEAPHWTTGRNWLLRLGCFHLQQPKIQADDWIWFIDHTVQIGQEKCLLILGIRASQFPEERPLQLADLQPIMLSPTKSANKFQVAEELEAATKQTGVPAAILSDHGADLHGGITLYRQHHPETRELYDLKHKAACLLKQLLQGDPRFQAYSSDMGKCKFQIQQTELGFLIPPSGRSKARFMNLEKFIGWGRRTLQVLDRRPESVLRHTTSDRLEQKLGWLRSYRESLEEWSSWLTMIQTAQKVVRLGVTRQTCAELQVHLPHSSSASTQKLRKDLLAFLAEQTAVLKQNERLPLMTEALESTFGRLKFLEKDQQKRGFTSLILSLGALVGNFSAETVATALKRTPQKAVVAWIRKHFAGGTHHANQTEAYAKNPKQIPEEP
jgi:hypothetical protein